MESENNGTGGMGHFSIAVQIETFWPNVQIRLGLYAGLSSTEAACWAFGRKCQPAVHFRITFVGEQYYDNNSTAKTVPLYVVPRK